MSNQSRTTYQGQLTTYFPDNTTELISEADIRNSLTDLSDSAVFRNTDAYLRIEDVTTGTEPAYVVTLTNEYPTAYNDRIPILFKAHATSTGAATLNVNAIGAKDILRPDGSATQSGDIVQDQFYMVSYDSGLDDFVIFPGFGGGADLAGLVTGPSSSTDNAIVRYDGTTGQLVQNSGISIDDETSNQIVIRTQTSDGSDNDSILINGGGGNDNSRGAHIILFGNESATQAGEVHLKPGSTASQAVEIYKPNGGLGAKMESSGAWDFQSNNISAIGTLSSSSHQISGTEVISSSRELKNIVSGSGTFYETGTFTPGIAFGGGTTGITYGTQAGFYTKIGNMVNIAIRIVLTNKGSSTGSATVTGLPFTSNTTSTYRATGSIGGDAYTGLGANVFTQITTNSTVISIYELNAGTFSSVDDTNFQNTTTVNLSITYLTN